MSTHKVGGTTVSGAALDTMYKLYWYGPQESGDIPSKAGLSELIDLKWASTDYKEMEDVMVYALTDTGFEVAHQYYRDDRHRLIEERNDLREQIRSLYSSRQK